MEQKGKRYRRIRAIEALEYENIRSDVKSVVTEKNEKQYVRPHS